MSKYAAQKPHAKLYATKAWKTMRLHLLAMHPLCVMCEQQGRTTAATVADHIVPHRGDTALFYSSTNLQPLCKTHHDSSKHRDEARGYTGGCDVMGNPIDESHPWSVAQRGESVAGCGEA